MSKKFSTEKSGHSSPWDEPKEHTSKGSKGSTFVAPRCYTTHPALKVGEFLIYGGSCSAPVVHDADVYIGFDHSMSFKASPKWPWQKAEKFDGVEFLFPITDMCAPRNAQDFKDLIDWTCNQLHDGKKIHAGCIGGHGRTGLFLSAVVAQMTGEKDAVTYVRTNYCDRAVESREQMEFLHKHYGVKAIKGAKEHYQDSGFGTSGKWSSGLGSSGSLKGYDDYYHGSGTVTPFPKQKSLAFSGSKKDIAPVPSKRRVW